jgi:hypothetical protein
MKHMTGIVSMTAILVNVISEQIRVEIPLYRWMKYEGIYKEIF